MSNLQTKQRLEYQDILDLYTSGCKEKNLRKTGIEYERLPVSMVTGKAVDYHGEFGVCSFLRGFARAENWDYITDDYNIIGLKQGHDTITLEPGCQVELSVEPQFRIEQLEKMSDVMMRETAGIQVCFDFESEEDAMRKFKIANKLSPFVTAMFANSPVRGGVDTGYKSFRALSWLNTDNERCGFAGKLQEDFSFDEYINYVMETPVIFINRNGAPVNFNGKINFKEFMLSGRDGFEPELEDYLLQANLCFPDVRLRNFIEIRNHDCGGRKTPYAILALYKGILYNKTAMDEIEELLKPYSYHDFSELRYNVPKSALDAKICRHAAKDIAKEILYISEKSLIEQDAGEEKYLDYIKEFTLQGITPADVLIRNWNGIWNRDIKKFIKYLASC